MFCLGRRIMIPRQLVRLNALDVGPRPVARTAKPLFRRIFPPES
jgi:hypothetical protein